MRTQTRIDIDEHGDEWIIDTDGTKLLMIKNVIFKAYKPDEWNSREPTEVVMHRDGNKLNNSIENLYLVDPENLEGFFQVVGHDSSGDLLIKKPEGNVKASEHFFSEFYPDEWTTRPPGSAVGFIDKNPMNFEPENLILYIPEK